ncbi:VOC family protein [Hazenella sp. IB182357]|uniref:VOC family protein n=1 Tax=Polycladospora coralii TaxID=2771432 RepID=A0A926NA65_9BACL|nr:VOC family protein [Polycladospora coralii]MBD1372727.1 VOC family protein [Polycladospora coralii]
MEKKAKDFYCGVLGLTEIEKPKPLQGRGGFWLTIGSFQIHVGTEAGIDRQQTKAHLAYLVDEIESWKNKLIQYGITPIESVSIPNYIRFEFRDPFGNRVEMLQHIR